MAPSYSAGVAFPKQLDERHRMSAQKFIKSLFFICFLSLSGISISSDNFSIKGFYVGQPMERCPDGTETSGEKVVMCQIETGTYAGAKVKAASVAVFQKEVIGAMIQLENRGRNANTGVVDALKERLGEPSTQASKPHIGTFIWRSGTKMTPIDSWGGVVVLADQEKYKLATKKMAETNKNDM
jgi:hypothetical protein